MEKTVTVKHGFWHDDTWYTAGNAQDVLKLPAEALQAQIDTGAVEVRDEKGEVLAAADAVGGV